MIISNIVNENNVHIMTMHSPVSISTVHSLHDMNTLTAGMNALTAGMNT